jgi:hypothetical protein
VSSSTFTELRTAVRQNTLSPTRYDDTIVGRWLNDAVADVCRRLRQSKALEVAAYDENGAVTLVTSFWQIREVWTATGATGVDPTDFQRRGNYRLVPSPRSSGLILSPSVGQPMWYEATFGPDGVKMDVLPVGVAGNIAVVGYARPTPMSADDDLSGLGPEADEALVAFCRARAFRREDDLNMSQMWEMEYTARLRSLLPAHIQHGDGPNVTPGYEDCWSEPFTGGG